MPERLGAEGSPTTVLGVEVLKERSSSTCFLFLSWFGSSACAGGDDVVELFSSSKTLTSSPSWLSSASGASEVVEAGSGGRETRDWWPYIGVSHKTIRKAETKYKEAIK
jgi:hypothetical protein